MSKLTDLCSMMSKLSDLYYKMLVSFDPYCKMSKLTDLYYKQL